MTRAEALVGAAVPPLLHGGTAPQSASTLTAYLVLIICVHGWLCWHKPFPGILFYLHILSKSLNYSVP